MADYLTYHPYYVAELEAALDKGARASDVLRGLQNHLAMRHRPRAAEPDLDDRIAAALRRALMHRRFNVGLYGHALKFLAPMRDPAGIR